MDYTYKGKLVRVVDGDTVIVQLDLGLRVYHEVTLRLEGLNAPEIIGASRVKGLASKQRLEELLLGEELLVQTYKTEKYGRWLGKIHVETRGNRRGFCANDRLLTEGFAAPYDGTGAKPE